LKGDSATKAVLSNLGTSVFQMLVGFGSSIILTRSLGQDGRGLYNAGLLVLGFYAPNLLLGYRSGVLYYGLRKIIDIRNFFYSGLLFVAILGGLGVTIIALLAKFNYLGSIISELNDSSILFVSIASLISLINGYFISVFRIRSLFLLSNITFSVGILASALVQFYYFFFNELNVQSALFSLCFGGTIQFSLSLILLNRNIRPIFSIQKNQLLKPFSYGLKSFSGDIVHQTNNQIDRIILSFLLLPSGFGIYVVGVGLANLLNKIPESYLNVLYNQITNQQTIVEKIVLLQNAHRLIFIQGFLVFLFLYFFGPYLIVFLYGMEFIYSYDVLWTYAVGLIFYQSAKVIIKFYGAIGKPFKNSMIYLVGMILGIPFYFILVKRFGIIGAAISSSIVYFISYFFAVIQLKLEFKFSIVELFRFNRLKINKLLD
jgi:O-antigen/teichoic acid export membrane protein